MNLIIPDQNINITAFKSFEGMKEIIPLHENILQIPISIRWQFWLTNRCVKTGWFL